MSDTIAKYYEALFKSDPLLLKTESQRKYIGKLVNNILGGRTEMTSLPTIFVLSDPESVAKFKRRQPKTSGDISPEDADALKDAYRRRIKVPEEAYQRLKAITMVPNGSATNNRLETLPSHDKAKDILTALKARSMLDHRLRIAAVGYRVRISKLSEEALLGEHLCFLAPPDERKICETLDEAKGVNELGRTRLAPNASLETWINAVEELIKQAYARLSHIIVLPEFSLPSACSQASLDIEKRLTDICKTVSYDHFIFAGSRHEGAYNRGMVFQKYKDKQPEETLWHYKVASARNLGENILGPHHNNFATYPISLKLEGEARMDFSISVALCYDAFDPTMFLSIVRQGLKLGVESGRQNVILVPSFNPSEDFVALLRDLSFLAQSVVVYVNALHGNAKLFICGFAVSDFADNKDGIRTEVVRFLDLLLDQKNKIQIEIDHVTNRSSLEFRQIKRRLQSLDNRIDEVRLLRNALDALEGSKGLDQILTVEPCEHCDDKKPHDSDEPCRRDILYYNLDLRLVEALRRFRANYIDDSLLPSAIRA